MLYLAPIQGITDRIFRNVFPKYFKGIDIAVAPFISTSKRKKIEKAILRELDPATNTGIPVIPQILSKDPASFIRLSDHLYGMGYSTINWNLGCPFPRVVNKGKGSGMLCHPIRVEEFLDKIMPRIKGKLSIKLRTGLVYPDEILSLIPVFNHYPLDELIIHPRTGNQMYEGNADIEMFSKCLEISEHEIVYNGDLDSAVKYETLAARFPSVKKWMIGRGLLADPFLAGKIVSGDNISRPDKIKTIREFHDELFLEYSKVISGPAHITDKMKALWTYLGNFFDDSEKIKKRIRKTRNADHYLDVINTIFTCV